MNSEVESFAKILEAHPDYRVLRRLQPCFDWQKPENYDQEKNICRVVILDTETTGLEHQKDKIIEMALFRIDVDMLSGLPVGPIEIYDGFEYPGFLISKEIEDITGITNEMLVGQKLDDEKISKMLENVDVVIAHNAKFDRPFCESRIGRFCDLNWACSIDDIGWKDFGYRSAKLESLVQSFGYFYDAHRAEIDCHALLFLLTRQLSQINCTGLGKIIKQYSETSYQLNANGSPIENKDRLRTRGYRWNAGNRVWHINLKDKNKLQDELEWLKSQVYNQNSAKIQVYTISAKQRYTDRSLECVVHQI